MEPMIIKGGRNIDLRSNLLEKGIIMLDSQFAPHMAATIIQQLLYLDTVSSKDPVQIYINSPGGCVHSGLAIYDTIKSMKRDVATVAVGMAASMGAFMLTCGGKKGLRKVTPNAQIMFHEVSAGASGRVSQMKSSYEHTLKLNKKLHRLIAEASGQKESKITEMFEKDIWLEGKEVIKFGAADGII